MQFRATEMENAIGSSTRYTLRNACKFPIILINYLRALVVRAVGLRLSEEREQPAHGHLMAEDALARVEAGVVGGHLEAGLLVCLLN